MYNRPTGKSGFRSPTATKSNITAQVKWYNATKGFGFASLSDGSPDAFLHVTAVMQSGYDNLPEGATLIVDVGDGPRGQQVLAVHSVDLSTARPSGPSHSSAPPRNRFNDAGFGDAGDGDEVEGTVKWFNETKGFGFIQPDRGGKDIFVHINALQRSSGLSTLADGQRVRIMVRQGNKGPEAASVTLI